MESERENIFLKMSICVLQKVSHVHLGWLDGEQMYERVFIFVWSIPLTDISTGLLFIADFTSSASQSCHHSNTDQH